MLENRHEILAEIISKYEDARSVVCFSDLERIFVKTLALLGECIGYIDAVKGGDSDG
jgi:hypothetical protein